MEKVNVDEIVRKHLNNIISEEMGVNLELDLKAERATESIMRNICGKEFRQRDDRIWVRTHTETVSFDGKSAKVYVTNYWFKDKKDEEKFRRSTITPQGYIYELSSIMIPLFSIGNEGFDEEDAADTVYHEVEHFFQTAKMGHNFEDDKLYSIAIGNLYSSNRTKRVLAEIIYICTANEQDAMLNGMYGSLKKARMAGLDERIKDSEAYVWYKKLCEDSVYLKQIPDDAEELELYNKTKNWFLHLSNSGMKRFGKKLARIVYKLKKDAQKADGYRPNVKSGQPLLEGQIYWLN